MSSHQGFPSFGPAAGADLDRAPHRIIGRYLVCSPIASGGMATVHLGRLLGPQGFSRTIAIKRLHEQFARDPDFVTMFLEEARLASRIRHPNVVAPSDVVALDDEVLMVMEYVHGEALSRLLRASGDAPVPPGIAVAIMVQVLLGLHAAHEASDELGNPLSIVHRDVSPQNILVDQDGCVKVVDFGIAKAGRSARSTDTGTLKGKLGYFAPEQLRRMPVDRRADVFAAGVVLWEMLTGQRLFASDDPLVVVEQMLRFVPEPPSAWQPELASELDAIVVKALAPVPNARFANARQMALALESCCASASPLEISSWVEGVAGDGLKKRAALVGQFEGLSLSELTSPVLRTASLSPPRAAGIPNSANSTNYTGVAPIPSSRRGKRQSRWFTIGALIVALGSSAAALALVLEARHSRDPSVFSVRPIAAAPRAEPEAPKNVVAASPEAPAPIPESSVSADAVVSRPVPARRRSAKPRATAAPPASVDLRASQRDAAAGDRPAASVEPKPSPAGAPRPQRRAECDVPYTIDESGRKRFRPECV
jgi:serine/threonine-protein kinase